MRIPGLKTARAISRWVKARVLGGALILGYHRISQTSGDVGDIYEVNVSPENFAEHLEVLSKFTHPVSLSKLVQHLQAGSLPPKSVAVTFDDGYTDNLYIARPLLEKYEIPATIFICTGYAGKEFWWDELDRLIISSTADLGVLHLQVGESRFQQDQPATSPDTESAEKMSLRRQFRDELYHFLLKLDVEDQSQAMQVIRNWSGLWPHESFAHRAMNHAELLQLAVDGLVELGSHTRNHPMLPHLSYERQKDEIVSGKRDLEELLGRQVAGFAYPNGRATADAKHIVCEAGFAYACTSLHDVVRPGSDLYDLTRFWQKDVGGEQFMQGLNLWMKMS